mgnify:CR=1 FL=1
MSVNPGVIVLNRSGRPIPESPVDALRRPVEKEPAEPDHGQGHDQIDHQHKNEIRSSFNLHQADLHLNQAAPRMAGIIRTRRFR